jgi:ribosomal protein L37AE/L43A
MKDVSIGRGHKMCPKCQEVVGPRTKVCSKCQHQFAFAPKVEKEAAPKVAKRAAKKSKK